MNLLFVCHAFHPSVGGIESSALLLIREFLALGHSVRVLTHTPLGTLAEIHGIEVFRRPGWLQQLRLARWADVVYQHNPSLTYLLPMLVRGCGVISVHTWVARPSGEVSLRDRLKLWWMRRWSVIANSRAMASSLPMSSRIIENAFDDQVFGSPLGSPWESRSGAVFVGRLVSDKGAEVALRAMAELDRRGLAIPLTVVGDGPERPALEATARSLGLDVRFRGRQSPAEVAELLQGSRYLLVPSLWEEPFGIVVLEGIASGCVVIASERGGLPDAMGRCGLMVPAGCAPAIADGVERCEHDTAFRSALLEHRDAHLEAHRPRSVAEAHLAVFRSTIDGRDPSLASPGRLA